MSVGTPLSTLFRLTLASGVPAAVALHLRRGAPVNGRDGKGRTPLILAAMRGHAEVCRLLLEAGADAAIQDADGRDALAAARAAGHLPVVALVESRRSIRTSEVPDEAPGPEPSHTEPRDDAPAECPPSADVLPEDPVATSADSRAGDGEVIPATAAPSTDTEDGASAAPESATDDEPAEIQVEWVAEEAGQTAPGSLAVQAGPEREPAVSQGTGTEAPTETDAYPSEPWSSAPANLLWEPEPEPLLSRSESGIEKAAAELDARQTRHAASTLDQDWSDTDLELPGALPAWATMFVDGPAAHRSVVQLLETALRHGWLPEEALDALAARATTQEKGEAFTDALRVALGDLGVLIEREHALDLSRDADDRALDEPALHRTYIDEAVEFADGMLGDFPDAERLLLEAAARAPVPSASQEASLFRELASAREAMLRLVALSISTSAILRSWADRLDTGLLPARSVSDVDWNIEVERAPALASVVDAAELDDASQDISEIGCTEEDSPAAKLLATRLRDAAKKIEDTEDAAPVLSAAVLTTSRLLELAEGALPEGRRFTPRHSASWGRAPRSGAQQSRRTPRRLPVTAQRANRICCIEEALDRFHASRAAIVEANLRRVVWQARRYVRPSVSLLDLVQEGQIGLLKAIDRYDIERGWRFGTYATWWLRQSMTRFVQDAGRTVRIPVHMAERIAKARRRAEAFRAKHGFEPAPADIADELELDAHAVERAFNAEREFISVDLALESIRDDDGDPDAAFAPMLSPLVSPETPLLDTLHADLRRCLLAALDELDERPRRIIDLRFGISDGNPLTLEEVGQLHGVTRERIRQIEAKTLDRLPRYMPSRHFDHMTPHE